MEYQKTRKIERKFRGKNRFSEVIKEWIQQNLQKNTWKMQNQKK